MYGEFKLSRHPTAHLHSPPHAGRGGSGRCIGCRAPLPAAPSPRMPCCALTCEASLLRSPQNPPLYVVPPRVLEVLPAAVQGHVEQP